MRKFGSRGFTLIEAIASFFVVSLVLTTASILIVNAHNRAEATRRQVASVQVGELIRAEVLAGSTYDLVSTWLAGSAKTLTSTTCADPDSPYDCSLFGHVNGGMTFATNVEIRFAAPDAGSLLYRVIRFTVVIVYEGDRTVVLEGVLCDA